MTDLHCHILPGIDDGAKTVKDSLALLRMEAENGVDEIVFTPHFDPEKTSVEDFVRHRAEAFVALQDALENEPLDLQLRLGAEVCFSASLVHMDLKPLCMGDSDTILLELPYSFLPGNADDILFQIAGRGYFPLLAHVERYTYLTKDPTMLYRWIRSGMAAQLNASTLLGKDAAWGRKLLKWGLVQVLATDSHSASHRPPRLKAGMDAVVAKFGSDFAAHLQENAAEIFQGNALYVEEPQCPRRFLGMWQ